MLEIAQLPLARRLWRISKFFQLPLSDERIQNLDEFDIEFYDYSMIVDDPKKLEQLKNHYYDPEFEEWMDEFEKEQDKKSNMSKNNEDKESAVVELPDEETIDWATKNNSTQQLETEEYEVVSEKDNDISDWEEVE